MNVGNCSRCGKLHAKNNIHDVCGACVKEIDKMYETVSRYLRDNRGSTIQQVSDATEVTVRQIMKFIQEGRISILSMPNMNYPCETCGTPIKEGHICESCRKKLAREVGNLAEDERRRGALRNEKQVGYNIKDRLQDRD